MTWKCYPTRITEHKFCLLSIHVINKYATGVAGPITRELGRFPMAGLGLFILSSFPRRRESIWSCHEKVAIGHGHVESRFRGRDEPYLTQSGK